MKKIINIWCKENGIQLIFIQPGEPTQNAYIERLNGTFRRDVLNAYLFKTIQEVKEISEAWVDDYNYHRPHQSLNNKNMPPPSIPGEYIRRDSARLFLPFSCFL